MNKEEQILIHRLMDLATMSYRKDVAIYSNFINLNEQNLLLGIKKELPPIKLELSGGFSYAERKIVGFLPMYFQEITPVFPLQCIKIKPTSEKYSQALTHRDYLGAILGLGLERDKIGDILIQDEGTFVFVHQVIGDFILNNLFEVKRTAVTLEEVYDGESLTLTPQFKEIKGSVSSIRLDAVTALGFSKSRGQMASLIQGGKVFVNSKLIQSNSYTLKEGDVVSVRGFGKFIYESIQQQTKKGRYFITINRFI